MTEQPTLPDHPRLRFDLNEIAPATRHWQTLDELREEHPFAWNAYGDGDAGYWVLTRYADILAAFQDPATFSNHSIVPTDPDPAYRFLPSFIDPPQHVKYRKLLNRWFAPKAVAGFAPEITRVARELVAEVAGDGATDYIHGFAEWFPVRVFLHSVGLPYDDEEHFVSCVRLMSGAATGKPEDVERMMAGWGGIAGYWQDLLARRRVQPADPAVDLVTHLMAGTIDGVPLPDADILDLMVTLTLGSLDTLASQLGWCLYHLATHPEDRRRLVADPALVPTAVEEFLRAYPIIGMARKLTRDVEFRGCPMRRDDMVLLSIPAATRDPRQFPDADRVDIARTPNRHIAFGASEHRCLGSHLARAELQSAITAWHELIPEYRLADGDPPLARGGQIALLNLPLVWEV
jgi:cytochrome P450